MDLTIRQCIAGLLIAFLFGAAYIFEARLNDVYKEVKQQNELSSFKLKDLQSKVEMLETFYRAYVEEKRDGEKLEKRVEALEKDIDNIKKKGESKGKLTTVIICENHQGYIRCDNDETIHIIQANYGRTEGGNICPHASIRDTNCYSTNAKGVVGTKCNGRRECNLESNNGIFGDPCIGTYKYMSVQFTCIPDSTNV